MDPQYQHEPTGSNFNNNFKQEDDAMGGMDEKMSTTPIGGYSNGYSNTQQPSRRQSVQSGDQPANGAFSPTQENADPNVRYPSNPSYQQQSVQPYSRPSSGLSGSGERHGYSQTYQEQNQRPSHQADPARDQSSVVIKVGMVGDAQIGKTSLMVKYVEGSWDEDYIQTLGMMSQLEESTYLFKHSRCQFHGENNFDTEHRNHFFYLGSRRATRICQHATLGL